MLRPDRAAAPPPEDSGPHPISRRAGRVSSLVRATHDVTLLTVALDRHQPFLFAAGQYARLQFDGVPPRDYSMANRPGEPVLEFHMRRVAGGAVGTHLAHRLGEGDGVRIEGPFGHAYLRERGVARILCIAGSTGLAPIKSIVETALDAAGNRHIHVYFGVREERDIYLEGHFAALARRHDRLRFVSVLSEPGLPTSRRTGLAADALAADFDSLDECDAYIAGPPGLVHAALRVLDRLGVGRERCFADPFYTDAEKAALGDMVQG